VGEGASDTGRGGLKITCQAKRKTNHKDTSGGINGEPTKADRHEGERVRDEIVRILTEKVSVIVATSKPQP
jgi:hypothetical protein